MPKATAKTTARHPRTPTQTHPQPQPYAGFRRNSGISSFALGPDFIIVEFRHDGRYLYTHSKPGRIHVEAMKRLAARGRGLATYINQHVRSNYADKLR